MKYNQVICVPLLLLAIIISLFTTACHSQAPPTANAPAPTPPNGAVSATSPTNGNAAIAGAANTNTPTSTAPLAQGGSTENCGACWVQIFDDKNFKVTDDYHTICGPGAWPHLRNLPGAIKLNWSDEIESLKLGPGATVTVWTGEQYTGSSHTFSPGTERMTLKDLPGFSDTISSLEIKCQ
jgi:hypothetical protein